MPVNEPAMCCRSGYWQIYNYGNVFVVSVGCARGASGMYTVSILAHYHKPGSFILYLL